jgi:geranylgeranyl diphosphate synthase type II
VASSAEELGKPVGQDAAHDRPSAVAEFGLDGALARLQGLTAEAIDSIPDVRGADKLKAMIRAEMKRLLPPDLAARID